MTETATTVTKRENATAPEQTRPELEDGVTDEVPLRAELTAEEAFGSVEPLNRPEDFEELIRIAKEERAERLLRKLREG